jgi:hypothetical protein
LKLADEPRQQREIVMNFNRLFARVAFVAVLGGAATVPAQVLGGNVTGGIGGTISGGLGGLDGMARGDARGTVGADVDAVGTARRSTARATSRAAGKVENTVQTTRTATDAAVSTSSETAVEAAAETTPRDVVSSVDASSSAGAKGVQRPSRGGPKASVMGDAALDASVDARDAKPAEGSNVSASAAGEHRSSASARSNGTHKP